jgi:hypothetical protein
MPKSIKPPADPGPYVSTYPFGNKLADEYAEEVWNKHRTKMLKRIAKWHAQQDAAKRA